MRKVADAKALLQSMSDELRDIRHFNEFCMLSCAPSLLNLRVFPNAKEISESMGCFEAVRRNLPLGWSFSDSNTICLSAADGSSPRTAALMAHMTKWSVISCDPDLREDHMKNAKLIERLTCYKSIVEEIPIVEVERACILAVHAHNNVKAKRNKGNILEAALDKIVAKHYLVVALPCCNDLRIGGINYTIEYKDPGIWSEKNTVRVWEFKRSEWERVKEAR